MRFCDIPKFTRSATYSVNVFWDRIDRWIKEHSKPENFGGLDLNPDFQRGYVWTPKQKTRYIEYGLRGGLSGLDLYLNCPGWNNKGRSGREGPFVIVDGKQRLQAVREFFKDKVPIFDGHYFSDFTDEFPWACVSFRIHVNDLETREEVLQWYIDLNSGGTVHSDEELRRVRGMIRKEKRKHGRR